MDLDHEISFWKYLTSGHVEVQQLQQHRIQSLQRQVANVLGKHQFVVDTTHSGILARKIP